MYASRDQLNQFLRSSLQNTIDFRKNYSPYPIVLDWEKSIHPGDLPVYSGSASDSLALCHYYPQLAYSRTNTAKVQIINIHHQDFQQVSGRIRRRALVRNSLFPYRDNQDRFIIPWAPLFAKWTPVRKINHPAFQTLQRQVLYVKDEGSDSIALYGNKARKYEFSFPFCLQTGAQNLVTFGSLSSNHCLFTALTAACANLGSCFGKAEPKALLNLYPQVFYPHILDKLKCLLALGAGIRFLHNDLELAYSILANQAREHFSPDDDFAYCEPGGSNPLTTLAHVNAVFELHEQLLDGTSPLREPPDYIYVPLGSGGTCMGLVLGCYLLGWRTKVVGTTSQDKSAWKRALIFGDPTRPFLVQNGIRLLEHTLELLAAFDLKHQAPPILDAGTILERHFTFDNTIWKPAYGIASERTKALMQRFSDGRTLTLDQTFSGKSFTTLMNHVQAGKLTGKKVLFWNTHQRFDFMSFPKIRDVALDLLPVDLQNYIAHCS